MTIPVRSLRLLPKSKSELDRLSGNKGEIFYDGTSKSLRLFDGTIVGGTQLNVSVNISDTPPLYPTQGSLWFNSANGSIYVYYQDSSSNQWIAPVVPAGLIGSGGGGSGSGTVNSGTAGKLAYYPNTGTTVDDLSSILWSSNTLNITGGINATAQKNYIRFHWDTLTDLNTEAPPSTWHGMVAHVHETGRLYVAHSANWLPLALLSDVAVTGIQAGTNVTISSVGGVYTINAAGGGGGGSSSNSFATISVAGQSDVVADSVTDILTLSGGTGITITTTPGSDTITFTNSSIPNSFATITVAGQSNVVADSSTDTLTLVAGTGITLTTNATTDTITVASGFDQLLNTTNNVVFNSVTASTLTSNGVGTPTYTSASDFIFNTGNSIGTLVLNGKLEVTGAATLGNLGIANGIASLGADGKLTTSQIPSSLTGAVVFKGTWNASTNTPTLADGSGTAGWEYAVSVSGTRNLGSGNITFVAGDYVIYNGTIWQQIPSSTIAAAGTLTGTTLNATIVSSSLTSVGTLVNLTVTNTITGSVSGNAGTVTSGVYTSGSYSDPTWLTLTKSKVGLGSVDNTTDIGKPISTLTQTALDLKAPKADPTFSGTVTLGAVGNVSITGGTTGQLLTTNGSGTLSWTTVSGGTVYTLPTASSSVLGGIKVGTGLSIDGSGVVSAAGGGVTAFTGLTDASSAGLTVDKIYLPAITRLDVTANGSTSYSFDQYAATNPTVYAINSTTIAFNLNVLGHPFLIQTSGGANYDTGLVHVTTAGVVTTGTNAQGKTSGTLYWKIPNSISGNYRYICSIHSGMVGAITIKAIASMV